MPLSDPVDRTHIHTRRIQCDGFLRDDGLWDIEARIVDTKGYAYDDDWRGRMEAGHHVHDMHVRLTVDERLNIRQAEAVTDASPYRVCPQIAPDLARIEGLRIGPGWMRLVKERFGGAHGCTHILELLKPMATTAYQAIFAYRERRLRESGASEREAMRHAPPVDSCHAYSAKGELVRRHWPEKYTGP